MRPVCQNTRSIHKYDYRCLVEMAVRTISSYFPGLNISAVGHLAGLLRVILVLVHDEGETRSRPRHPNLSERSEFAESLLEVPFGGLNRRHAMDSKPSRSQAGAK